MLNVSPTELEKIIALCRRRPNYAVHAYLFMLAVVREASKRRAQYRLPGEPNLHITGQQLLLQARKLLLKRYGPMATTVLELWGVNRTEDFGEMIFDMVAQEILSVSDDDTINDFADSINFKKHLTTPYEVVGTAPPLPKLD